MSGTAPTALKEGASRVRKKLFLVFLIFTFLGPLFGLLSFFAIAALRTVLVEPESFPDMTLLKNLIGQIDLLYAMSLLYGGLQAAIVGAVAAASYVICGRVSFIAVIASTAIAYGGFLLAVMGALSRTGRDLMGANLWLMAVPHFVAAYGCWILVSRWRKEGAT